MKSREDIPIFMDFNNDKCIGTLHLKDNLEINWDKQGFTESYLGLDNKKSKLQALHIVDRKKRT